MKLPPIINESKLYYHPTFAQQQEASLTVVALSQEGAMKILNSRRQGDEPQYLVKWQGQPFKESTWEDRCKIVKRASCLCWDFHKNHPDAPRIPTVHIPRRSYSEVARTRP